MADINVIVLPDGTEYPVSDYYLPVAISNPTAGQVLKYDAENQVWYNGDDAEGSSVFYGTSAPASQLGVDGNLYVKYTEGTGGASDTVDALYVKLDGTWCQISTGGGGGTSDYNDLTNKPQINSVELSGNKSLDDLGIQPSEISKTATGSIVTFSDGGDNIPVDSFECEIVATGGGGTPDNPIAINGFSQADITNAGKYIRVIDTNPQTYSQNGIDITTYANGKITINGTATEDVTITINVNPFTVFTDNSRTININNDFINARSNILFCNGSTTIDTWSFTSLNRTYTNFTAMSGKYIDNIKIFIPSGQTINNGSLMSEFIVMDTATTYTVSFGQTIYGGRLIYANGQWFIRVTHGIVDLGTLDYSRTTNYGNAFFYAALTTKGNSHCKCDIYTGINATYASSFGTNALNYQCACNVGGTQIFIRNDDYTDADAFKTAMSGVQLVYELATPLLIPLTSTSKIKTLSGVNNIFSNTGDSTVKYFTNDADGIEELINVSETFAENTAIDDTNLEYEADNVQEAFEKITKSLTYAEYQALSEEEKNNGTVYFITDVNGDGQDFQPVIYSEEEREIGVWKDGKPIYQKTWEFETPISISYNSWTQLPILSAGIAKIIDVKNMGGSGGNVEVMATIGATYIELQTTRNASGTESKWLTLRYTKSTDAPGSGIWTPQGVPAHHYSTNEHIVGTWIDGKTLYERTVTIENITIPVSGGYSYSISSWNVDTIVKSPEGFITVSNDTDLRTLPFGVLGNYAAEIASSRSAISFSRKGNDLLCNRVVFTLTYTKTS